jgi:hypothetical protein
MRIQLSNPPQYCTKARRRPFMDGVGYNVSDRRPFMDGVW